MLLGPIGPLALGNASPWTQSRNMETTRASGTINVPSVTAIRALKASIASVGFGTVLVGLSIVSTAIEQTVLNWAVVALLALLMVCGLALIGIIVQALSSQTGDQSPAPDGRLNGATERV